MSNSMQEAIEEAGILETMKDEDTTPERPKWHQQFHIFATKFEIPTLLHVRCDTKQEGSRYIRERKLNSCLTAKCKDEAEAREQLYKELQSWYDDEGLQKASGQLIYWKLYDA